MQNLCIAYRDISNKHKLYASGTTGYLIDIDALIREPTNLATAELIILSLDRGDLNWCEMYR